MIAMVTQHLYTSMVIMLFPWSREPLHSTHIKFHNKEYFTLASWPLMLKVVNSLETHFVVVMT